MTSADLVRELRAARPTAPQALRGRVRAIVDAGPPRRSSFAARRLPRRRALLIALPATAVAAAAAAGVVGLVRDHPTAPRLTAPAAYETTAPPSASGAAGATESLRSDRSAKGADAAGGQVSPSPTTDRAQRYSATIALEVQDTEALSEATQRAITDTRSLGGHLVTVSYGAGEGGSASLLLRVPTARVQDAVARLSALGTITRQNVQIDDLQSSLDGAERRAAELRARIAAISAQLDREGLGAAERARLVETRRSLRSELVGARESARSIRDEATMATIQLELRTESEELIVPPPPSRFDRAIDDAVEILAIEGVILLFALVVGLPVALAAAGVWLGLRAMARRDRERLLGRA